jgi:hypothetical protein
LLNGEWVFDPVKRMNIFALKDKASFMKVVDSLFIFDLKDKP